MEDIAFFLPTRKGSSRVKNKNTRPFAEITGGLLANKLTQLVASEYIGEIILSTNDNESIEVGRKFNDNRIKIIERPNNLCLDTTSLSELINYVPEVVTKNHVIWGHVTTPFAGGLEYDRIIESYFKAINKGYDSLVTVKRLQNFLIDPMSGEIINTDKEESGRWPRTQDLDLIYEVNHVAFVNSIANYKAMNDRLGIKKYFFEQDEIISMDIDWEEDFRIAEAIQKELFND